MSKPNCLCRLLQWLKKLLEKLVEATMKQCVSSVVDRLVSLAENLFD